MSHDVAYNLAFAKEALILAGERIEQVEAALTANLPTEPVKRKRRKSPRPKTAAKPGGAAHA